MALQIVTTQRKWDQTCTKSANLTENQISRPEIRDIIMYAEPRMLSTLIAAGVESSWQTVGTVAKTKIGVIPKDKLIGSNAYIYEVMTRIQRNTEILGQVGTSGADGSFRLRLRDNIFYPGMNTQFHNDSFSARCMSVGVPSTTAGGGWVFEFKTNNGHVFDYSLDVAPQAGTKTCFGGNTSYEEGSKRGYSYSFFGDKYVNHLTTQRKSIGMTGDALTDVTWVMYNGEKGWFFTKEARLRLQMMMEDEHAKWHGRSNMRDEDGNLLSRSNQIDPETGKPKLDKNNEDASAKSKPVLGLINIWGFEYKSESLWEGGNIYDPKNGNTYSSTMRLINGNTLEVRGFIGVSLIGRTDTWTRQVAK